MGLITRISLRNLIRQKRRNILLGIGIALSMCILVMIFALTSGITDNIFNKVLVYAFGHMRLDMMENTGYRQQIIRDKDRFISMIEENIEGIGEVYEDVSTFVYCRGNGVKTSRMVLVGLDPDPDDEFFTQMKVVEGNREEVFLTDTENTVLIYQTMADELGVKVNDIIRVKLTTISGQINTARLRVAAIVESQNMFMSMVGFIKIDRLKNLMGLEEQETIGLTINMESLENPDSIKDKANKLHAALKPDVAGITAKLFTKENSTKVDIFALKTDEAGQAIYKEELLLTYSLIDDFVLKEKGILLSEATAKILGVKAGDNVEFLYKDRFNKQDIKDELLVVGIIKANTGLSENIALVHEEVFYDHYFAHLPEQEPLIAEDNALYPALVMQYRLLERSPDTDSYMKKAQDLRRNDWKGAVLDVTTMHEFASVIISLQYVLNGIAIIAVAVIFVVILIGVVNTLRMTIRERTREIGTNRAIGMQRKDIIKSFMAEIFFLSISACAVGLILAFFFMNLLSLITIDTGDSMFGMFLVDNHLYFVPRISLISTCFAIITLIAVFVAFFPSRRAAKMSVASALRHYE